LALLCLPWACARVLCAGSVEHCPAAGWFALRRQ
jgi:hypothetical protein